MTGRSYLEITILTDCISISDLAPDIKITFDRENKGEEIKFCSRLNVMHCNQCNSHIEHIWYQRQVACLLISNKYTLLENFNWIGPEIFTGERIFYSNKAPLAQFFLG